MQLCMQAFSIQNSIGFGVGAILFHVGGLMMLARQSLRRCRPSPAKVRPLTVYVFIPVSPMQTPPLSAYLSGQGCV